MGQDRLKALPDEADPPVARSPLPPQGLGHAGPSALVSGQAQVGEGPVYDPGTNMLFWVDIPLGRLWRCDLVTREVLSREVGEPLGCVALVEGGGFLLAARHGILFLPHWTAVPRLWLEVETCLPTQFNDGKCDARGRFVVGTAARAPHEGALYRIGPGATAHRLVGDLGMSNGLDWSPDERFFYHVDSRARTVTRYDWDPVAGVPHRPEVLIAVPRSDGLPDGLTVDAAGFIWVAIWGAGQLRRYDPEGGLVGTITLPTPNVSSCTFGGPGLNQLFITTAAQGAPADGAAGSVFVVETAACGQRRTGFTGHALPTVADPRR